MDKTWIKIRAWSSEDGWWLGCDERLQATRYFKRYGLRAKLYYLYCRLFYNRVLIEISEHDSRGETN